ncbi:MAG: DUF3098 domain-containing protein [Bacteroidales bacterium]|nr:DUF3098 domain-containing protein [Candidatus Colimorpha pelethequi]
MNTNEKETENKNFDFVFGKTNYILMVAGIIILVLGYILLSGGGSDDPNTFNPAMFNAQRLYVSPILIVVGFVVEIFAIMFNPNKGKDK